MIIVFVGPPFCGKGTQAELLGRELGMPVFSMGQLIREAYRAGNPKAIEGFEKYSLKGLHVPVSLKFNLLKEKMDGAKEGFILDNFPATQEDLNAFLDYLKENSLSINELFYLNISEDEMLRRMGSRGRPDDTAEIVLKRREIQDKDRIPVLEYFKNKGILEEINGEGQIDNIHQEIMRRMGRGKEIRKMAEGGRILAEVLSETITHIKPGVSEIELDKLAEKLILKKGAEPGFKKVKGYNNTLCVSVNDVVVHGVPSSYQLKEGDIIGIDCGVYYKGFYTDMAETILVENGKLKVENGKRMFLRTGKKALEEAIKAAKLGNRVGDISKTIQNIIEGNGYSVVRSLVGHGVGKDLHEEPEVPGFLEKPNKKTPLLSEGMTLAIEVIYNMGKSDVVYKGEDGWTIKTKDGSLSSVFEKTVAVTKNGPLVLTK